MRRSLAFALALGLPVAAVGIAIPVAAAAGPATVTVPQSPGMTASAGFMGTAPPGANPTGTCQGLPGSALSSVPITVNVPAGTYDKVNAKLTVTITWDPVANASTSDLALTVLGPDGKDLGDSDGGDPKESVTLTNPVNGNYTAVTCGDTNTQPQDYKGTASVTTTAADGAGPPLPLADPKGLSFGASVAADIQRNESEPNMEIDQGGNIYTCGPTGFSNADDYAQVSTDGGDQFHLLGTPPRGQQGIGGGGDCGLATSAFKNTKGKYTYSYTGLGPLTGFTTSSSDDSGQTLQNGGPQGNTDSGSGALTDRQWQVFTDPSTVLLSYNQQMPRNVVVQKSTDGGVTYPPNGVIAAPSPLFPGPMRILKADLNPFKTGKPMAYFAWNNSNKGVNLSVSPDGGTTWNVCTAGTAAGDPSAGFMTVDNDTAGNVYLAYADKATYSTFLTSIKNADLAGCNQQVVNNPAAPGPQPTKNPGFTKPVRVNRGTVATTVFPWLVAGGEPGRVAIAYLGTQTPQTADLTPDLATFKASWDVYVSQSLDGLSADPSFGQVKATSHPMHYDSICLSGTLCTATMGDRSLGDFFALDFSPTTHKLSLVYDQSSKKPDEAGGRLATPAVVTQNGGPSNGGPSFDLGPTPTRPALRDSSTDPKGDALSAYSQLVTPGAPNTSTRTNEDAADLLSDSIGPQHDTNGAVVPNGGFDVTMKIADLSDAALMKSMQDTASGSLLWIFRFANGFTASGASARYDPVQGFTYGFNDYTSSQCGGGNCQKYPGGTALSGKVDKKAGTITISVPRALLRGLSGGTGPGERPKEVPATAGTRLYDAAVYSVGNTSATQDAQSYLYPLDNTPSMDFLVPGAAAAPAASASPCPSSSPSGGGLPIMIPSLGLGGASASPSASSTASSMPSGSASPCPSTSSTATASASPSASNSATTGRFHPLTPARIFDTRQAPRTPVKSGTDQSVQVSGMGGVPTNGVSAVVLNVTVTGGSARGDVQVYPTGQKPASRTSNQNYFRGQAIPVQVQLGLGTGGKVNVSVNTGSAQVIVDVFGYYGDGSESDGSGYTALQPQRLLDTRTKGQSKVAAGTDKVVQVSGSAGVPATATAVTFNATLLGTPANADLQVFPTGARPTMRTSNLNVSRGLTKANAVTTPLSSDGKVSLSISQNSADVVLDVIGYYSASSPGRFIPLKPQRIFDTRSTDKPMITTDRRAMVRGKGGVPDTATAAVLSVTATGAGQSLDLQVAPTGNRPANRTSTLNLRPAEAIANLDPATLGSDGSVTLSISRSQAQVILDVVGYFTGS